MIDSIALFLAAFLPGFVLLMLNKQLKGLRYLLAFSGAYLVSLIFTHLAPGVYAAGGTNAGLWIIIGFLIQIILEFMSHGAEHGHVHHHTKGFPIGVMVGLLIHAFLEGLPFHNHHGHVHDHAHSHDHQLLIGIVIHQIPISIALASMVMSSGFSRISTFLSLIVFGLAAPAGAFFSGMMNVSFIEQYGYIFDCLVIGVLLHIATTILFETDSSHRVNLIKLGIIAAGLSVGFVEF